MSLIADSYDAVILGGGFGGTLLAAILSKRGQRVAVIDRGCHPRFTIGESSTPSADFLLERLVDQYELTQLRPLTRFGSWQQTYPEILCGCKRGFSYFWHGGVDGFQSTTDHRDELLVAASESREKADTQWYRPDVDAFFAVVAEQCGVEVFEQTEVSEIRHVATSDWRLQLQTGQANGSATSRLIQTPFLVDATGPAGVLMKRLEIADQTDQLLTHSSAIYSHWDNPRSLTDWLSSRGACLDEYPYTAEDSAVHHLFSDGWLWHLRFENGRTSVGYLFDETEATGGLSRGSQSSWDQVLNDRPVLKDVLGNAPLSAFPGKVYQTDRLQRCRAIAASDDWAALPFTAGFIDPMHSTGIAHTISGVQRIAEILLTSTAAARREPFRHYSESVIKELKRIDQLIWGCYVGLANFRLFTAWSMIYFALATTFERMQNDQQCTATGFLALDQPSVTDCLDNLTAELRSLVAEGQLRREDCAERFSNTVRQVIAPLNQVGLFEPPIPNMYHRTAAK